jgi:hypothetical protein
MKMQNRVFRKWVTLTVTVTILIFISCIRQNRLQELNAAIVMYLRVNSSSMPLNGKIEDLNQRLHCLLRPLQEILGGIQKRRLI